MTMNMRKHIFFSLIAFAVVLSLKGEKDMPKLRWVDDDKSRNAVSNVVMKILREDKSLGYAGNGLAAKNAENAKMLSLRGVSESRREDSKASSDLSNSKTPSSESNTDNILVHGDNLEALKALLPFYAGRVKCIYIDPPYNTGSAFEHYDDNLEHSTWLNIMYPRLKLLREFLREDGSIWISIDDDEQAYMKVMCDEIFGRQNFVTTVVWQKRTSPDMRAIMSDAHDFILLYTKNKEQFKEIRNQLPLNEEQAAVYKNPDNDPRGPWTSTDFTAQGWRPNQMYEIVTPSGAKVLPPEGRCWRHVKEVYERLYAEQRLWFGSDGSGVPRKKVYLSECTGVTPWTWWSNKEVGHNQEAKKENNVLFGTSNAFETPKPERLIQRILTIATNPGDLVLDSFLGSGTTAAVAHKMGRRWIGIEMGEHAKTHCAVRMKKVIDGEQGGISKAVNWQGGGGFKFYELGEPLLDENGAISEGIEYDTLAAHIWWRETDTSWDGSMRKGTFLGVHDGVAYAMLYNGVLHDRSYAGGNVLTPKTMRIIREDVGNAKYDRLIVYGECTKLSSSKLKEANIEFRQTPYDIVTRR